MKLIACLIASASVLALTPACVCKKTGKTTEEHNDQYIFKWEDMHEFDVMKGVE